MGRPADSYLTLMGKGKSHVTKKELEIRKKAEQSLLTQIKFKEKPEIKANPIAHKEFLRIKKLFVKIDKNDGLFENGVNRYCLMYAECKDFEDKREKFYESIDILENEYDNGDMEAIDYLKTRALMQTQVLNLDKQVMQKRRMLLDIEKENLMTIAAALRVIPKGKKEEVDPNADLFGK